MASRILIHRAFNGNVKGKKVLIINSSLVIGKPLASMLSDDKMTVTIANRDTGDYLYELARNSDVVVTATGVHNILKPDQIKPGAVLIDVAIKREGDRIFGDFDTDAMLPVVGKITPVPRGVGPRHRRHAVARDGRAGARQP